MNSIVLFLASGFGSGYAPFAPGTAGTLVGIVIFYQLNQFSLLTYGILTTGLLFSGVWLSSRAETIRQEKDSRVIVIDEISGFLVTMFAIPVSWTAVIGGFLLFRAMDILKPFPIRWIDRNLRGGWGVMLDDVLAGVYANVILHLLRTR